MYVPSAHCGYELQVDFFAFWHCECGTYRVLMSVANMYLTGTLFQEWHIRFGARTQSSFWNISMNKQSFYSN